MTRWAAHWRALWLSGRVRQPRSHFGERFVIAPFDAFCLSRAPDDPWAGRPESATERIRRQREETARGLASQLVDADERGCSAMSVTIGYERGELSLGFEKRDCAGSPPASAPRIQLHEARKMFIDYIDMVLLNDLPKTMTSEFGRQNGRMVSKGWNTIELPTAPSTALGTASAIGECNEGDTDYGECLNRQRRAAYRAGIRAAGEVADAFYNPFSGGGGGGGAGGALVVVKLAKELLERSRVIRQLDDIKKLGNAQRRALLDELLKDPNGLTHLANRIKGLGGSAGHTLEIATAQTKRGETVFVAGLNTGGTWTAAQKARLNELGIRIAPQRRQLFRGMSGKPHAEENIAAYLHQKGWKGTRWSRAVVGDPTRKRVGSYVCHNCQNMIDLVGGYVEPGLDRVF